MTDEKIISFARMIRDGGHWHQLDLISFARMIETHLSYASIHSCGPDCDRPACVNVRRVAAAEREACAKVCEENLSPLGGADKYFNNGVKSCVKAIRARGQE
jgi:hypothetical protein